MFRKLSIYEIFASMNWQEIKSNIRMTVRFFKQIQLVNIFLAWPSISRYFK